MIAEILRKDKPGVLLLLPRTPGDMTPGRPDNLLNRYEQILVIQAKAMCSYRFTRAMGLRMASGFFPRVSPE